jgi:hypothetical protein
MAKKKLLTDMVNNPARYYRMPADVLRDRRFADDERREILKAWEAADDARIAEVRDALSELESRGLGHAAE